MLDSSTAKRVTVGTFARKGDAEHVLAVTLAAQAQGTWVPRERGQLTLDHYAARWIEDRLNRSGEALRPRVKELYGSYLRLHIGPSLGHLRLADVTTVNVRRWHSQLLADGPGASTAAKCYRLLRAILSTAVEDRLITINPCTIKGAGVEPVTLRSVPTPSQAWVLAAEVQPRFRALVLLAAFVGLRKGELLGLERGHVDLTAGTLTVALQRQQSARGQHLVGPPKTAAGKRTLVLPPDIASELADHLARWTGPGQEALVFPGEKGGPLRTGVLQHEWDRARRRLGLEKVRLHDLRHLAGTMAASTGAGTKELMHRLGHASPQAAQRYQHATRARDSAIAEAMNSLIRLARDGVEWPGNGRHPKPSSADGDRASPQR
ncbi:MAG: site-specific integrase [Acidimicrobiia bacterium]|nr:site-specific integrase [Acidimicrobiia bacterium]